MWKEAVEPFYWFVDFPDIMADGGFNVVIGNPPWKEYSAVRRTYTVRNFVTESCGNLHGMCTERGLDLLGPDGRISFIVQLPLANSSRMDSVRRALASGSSSLFVSTYDDRPGKLFKGLQNCRSTIFCAQRRHRRHRHDETPPRISTSGYYRWPSETRSTLFDLVEHVKLNGVPLFIGHFPKYATQTEEQIFRSLNASNNKMLGLHAVNGRTDHFVFYQEATRYWIKATIGLPYYAKNGIIGAPAHGRYLYFRDEGAAHAACAVLNSSLFYAYFIAYGDCFHLSDTLATSFPVPPAIMVDTCLIDLSKHLMADLTANAETMTIRTRDGATIAYAEFSGSKSKPIIDEIDRVLAQHYGFTDEELDFIVNYDIKYRLGRDAGDDEA